MNNKTTATTMGSSRNSMNKHLFFCGYLFLQFFSSNLQFFIISRFIIIYVLPTGLSSISFFVLQTVSTFWQGAG